MDPIVSEDGTLIAHRQSGAGPPLVLVHGTGIDHTYWDPVVPELSRHFTTYAVDRRGRGESGDPEVYAIEREFEDVASLVDSIPGPVHLVGHSYGALCSLEVSLLSRNIGRMVLYEPLVHTTVPIDIPEDAVEEYDELVASGRSEKALMMMYAVGDAPHDEVDALRSQPNWATRVTVAGTIPREMYAARAYHFDPARFRGMKVPTMLVSGSDTSAFYKAATAMLAAVLPNCHTVILMGHGHEGVVTAPGPFLREVIDFLNGGA